MRSDQTSTFLLRDNRNRSVDLMNWKRCGSNSVVDRSLPRFLASLPAALNIVHLAMVWPVWVSHRMT